MTDADATPDEADPEMVQVNLRLSEAFLADIDATWKEQGFNSRSEFLRYVARDAVRHPNFSREGWKQIAESEHGLRSGGAELVSREEVLEFLSRIGTAEGSESTRTPLTDDVQSSRMSDVSDDGEREGRGLSKQAGVDSLRDRMRRFVDETDGYDLKQLRQTASNGKPLSDVVIEDRNDRV